MATADALNQVTSLLKENRVQEAADLSAQLAAEAKAVEDAAAGKVPEPPPPRAQGEIVIALLREIVAHLGHTPRMAALVDELEEAAAQTQ
jgi:hypothetical protein